MPFCRYIANSAAFFQVPEKSADPGQLCPGFYPLKIGHPKLDFGKKLEP